MVPDAYYEPKDISITIPGRSFAELADALSKSIRSIECGWNEYEHCDMLEILMRIALSVDPRDGPRFAIDMLIDPDLKVAYTLVDAVERGQLDDIILADPEIPSMIVKAVYDDVGRVETLIDRFNTLGNWTPRLIVDCLEQLSTPYDSNFFCSVPSGMYSVELVEAALRRGHLSKARAEEHLRNLPYEASATDWTEYPLTTLISCYYRDVP